MPLKNPSKIQNFYLLKLVARFVINPSAYLFPKRFLTLADPERAIVDRFIQDIENASKNQLLLDAGAGNFRYRELLVQKGYSYQSQDFDEVFEKSSSGMHTYVCDIQSIPVESNRYDVVICTQVLEHVTNPQNVFIELARILKPGGKIYLTTNFLFPIHGAPYDFYRFTHFGLHLLAKESSLTNIEISSRGGFFSLWAKLIYDFPAIMKAWLFYGGATLHGQRELSLKNPVLIIFVLPSIFFLDLFCTFCAGLIRLLDPIDKRKRFTLGYQLIATRE